jgi:FG-GAP repeat/FG-GAP-like repeat
MYPILRKPILGIALICMCTFILCILSNYFTSGKIVTLNQTGQTQFNEQKSEASCIRPLTVDQYRWYDLISKNIAQQQYYIKTGRNENNYESYNPIQKLQVSYTNNGIVLKSASDQTSHSATTVNLEGIYTGNTMLYKATKHPVVTKDSNHIVFNHQNFSTDYRNYGGGVEETFIIHQQPSGIVSNISVHLSVSGNLLPVDEGNNQVALVTKEANGSPVKKLTYDQLKVWDKNGKALDAKMHVVDDEIYIDANVSNAVYPLTIDPTYTSADWGVESNQANSAFGCSIYSAGDVNGDGYSDVLIGANKYTNNALTPQEGAVFLYYGGPSGIATTAAWSYYGGQSNAELGTSVNTVTDVNGDGYGDIIVGAPKYDDGETDEGKVFAFYGNAGGQYPGGGGGLTASPQWTAQCNQAGANFGISVSSAGDFDQDGYGDVLIGANLYDNGQTDEGAVFLYKGGKNSIKPYQGGTGSNGGIRDVPFSVLEMNQANANFGFSVSTAGDLNGDNYYDIVAGANLFDGTDTDEGAAFIWYGTSSVSLSATPNVTLYSTETATNKISDNFGCSVSTGGDANGDGYSDLMIGCDKGDNPGANEFPEFGPLTNNGKVYFYTGSSTGISTIPITTREGKVNNGQFGTKVSCGGDWNGDGYADMIVGCPSYVEKSSASDPLAKQLGRFYIYEGMPDLTSIAPYINIYTGVNNNDNVGYAASPAGDINGDGFSDFIFSSITYTNVESNEGKVWALYGAPRGLSAATLNYNTQLTQAGALLGYSVACAGDVNGDGITDYMASAPNYDQTGFTNNGAVFIYHGTVTGPSTTYTSVIYGNQNLSTGFGRSISTAGDVNGDGYSDILIGDLFYDNGANTDAGKVELYLGSSSGISTTPAWTYYGTAANQQFGCSVACAGDINLDGYSDIIIGAKQYTNGETNEGAAFLFHGMATASSMTINWSAESNQVNANYGYSVACAGDVNGDGFNDVIVGAPDFDEGQTDEGKVFVYHGSFFGVSTTANWTKQVDVAGVKFGYSVSSAGDINGDAFMDVIIGAPYFSTGAATTDGKAYVYNGSSSGLGAASSWSAVGTQTAAHAGACVASAGDVNGDGYSDVIMGIPDWNQGSSDDGRAQVFHGAKAGISTTANWTAHGQSWGGTFGYSLCSVGDINADGYGDVLLGLPLYDNSITDRGQVRMFYGNEKQNCRNNIWLTNSNFAKVIDRTNLGDNLFGLAYYARSFTARCQGRATWEVKKEGLPFHSYGALPISKTTVASAAMSSFPDLTVPGLRLNAQVAKVVNAKVSKVRVRVTYPAVAAITGQIFGPWRYSQAYMMGGFGMWSQPLPIKLTSFHATLKNSRVDLIWTAENEEGNEKFVIERSTDSRSFTALDTVDAFAKQNRYQYTDLTMPLAKKVYYRLRVVSVFATQFSAVKEVQLQLPLLIIQQLDASSVQIKSTESYFYRLLNMNGQLIQQGNKSGNMLLSLQSLTRGTYVLKIATTTGEQSVKQLIVQ